LNNWHKKREKSRRWDRHKKNKRYHQYNTTILLLYFLHGQVSNGFFVALINNIIDQTSVIKHFLNIRNLVPLFPNLHGPTHC